MSEEQTYPEVCAASQVLGVGMSLPERVVTNEHFASYLETTDEWIVDRTGIKERRWVDTKVCASELAEPAARQAIERARLTTDDIDGIILATITPDCIFPSTACYLQKRLQITRGFAFDVNAVCSGFMYALVTADAMIAAGHCRNCLVVGVDIYSAIIDPNDRGTCVLFGDGAGAVVLSATSSHPPQRGGSVSPYLRGNGSDLRGIYATELCSDGSGADLLYVPNGTAFRPTPQSLEEGQHYLRMAGREVFKLAVRRLSEISERVLERAGFGVEQVDYFITHQANKRIITSMAKHFGVSMDKVLINVDRYGNTSAASIPILLAESEQAGVIKKGDLLLLTAFGGGLTWAGALLRW